ncbi:MAG: CvpA family protein [Solobacterium sp.]|nr:CvpA family protein [Solobacterium sp.]
MFTVTNSWIWPVNIGLVVVFAIFIAVGWKKGIIRMAISVIGSIASFYIAWALSSVLGKYFRLWPKDWAVLQNTSFAEAAEQFLNQICWFLLLFLILRVVFVFLDIAAKNTQKLPVVGTFSSLLGSAASVIEAAVITMVASVVLQTPMFVNGTLAVTKTLIKPVNDLTAEVFHTFAEPVISSEALNTLADNVSFLTKKEQDALSTWLDEHGYKYNTEITEIIP